jgi:hypothetical protein
MSARSSIEINPMQPCLQVRTLRCDVRCKPTHRFIYLFPIWASLFLYSLHFLAVNFQREWDGYGFETVITRAAAHRFWPLRPKQFHLSTPPKHQLSRFNSVLNHPKPNFSIAILILPWYCQHRRWTPQDALSACTYQSQFIMLIFYHSQPRKALGNG